MNKANLELIYRKFSQGGLTKAEALQLIEATQAGLADCRLHPLVHHNVSDLQGLRFGATFNGDEFFLRDHRVQGRKVLPGVAYLEMARVAVGLVARGLQPEATEILLQDVTWLAPLVVAEPTDIAIVVTQDDADAGLGCLRFEIRGGGATPTVHARGAARFLTPATVAAWDLAALRDQGAWRCLSGAFCYERFETVGIQYGVAHRVLETLWADNERVLAKLVLPSAYHPSLTQYQLQPGLLDGALQAAVVLADGSGAAKPALPFALDAVETYGALSATMWVWLRPAEARHAERLQKRDIDLCDEQGQVRVRLKGLVSRVLQSEAAPIAVATPTAELLPLAPLWQTLAAPSAVAGDGRGLVFVGGEPARRQALAVALPGAQMIEINGDMTVEEIAVALAATTDMRHLVWLSTPAEDDDIPAAQAAGVYALFRVIKALVARNLAAEDFSLTVITTNVFAVGDEMRDVTHAAVHGLIGSLAKEWPHWSVRLFDLPRDQAWPLAQLFGFEPDPRGDARVYRHGQWFQQRLAPLALPADGDAPYRLKGTYVVIGGAGGLGEVWTRQLVCDYGANVVWLGRRAEDERIRRQLDALEALGPRPLYLAVDAGDEEALHRARTEILRRFDAVHGLVHAALVLADESLVAMQEAGFRAALHAKLATSVAAARVFADDALDFVLFFSSLNAFEKSPGQANYAAACTFQDAFAAHLRQCCGTTVKVMNWGYWGGVGRVKDPFYQTRMARAGVGSLEPAEGLAALEQLLCAPLDQVALVKVTRPQTVEERGDETLHVADAGPDCLAALQASCDTAPALVVKDQVAEWCALGRDLDQELAALLHERLLHFDLLCGDVTLASPYDRWLAESRRILRQHGLIGAPTADAAALWARWEKRVTSGDAAAQAQAALVDVCLRGLGDVLTGRKQATEVLFPNSSTALVEQVYKGAESANLFNDHLAEVVAAYVAERRAREPHCRLRLLEIGAGTGGTTVSLLHHLAPHADAVAEYCFTDISKAFLFEAEKRWQAKHPYLRTARFDVSADPAAQGFDVGAYDLVIATNVLHATADIRTTLRHGKALLRRNGLLCLNEMSRNSLYSHLTFGLLDGWWRYQDEALRLPGCPGLSAETWARVLGEEGLRGAWFPLDWAADLGQQLIVAAGDGVVRRRLAEPAAPAVTAAPEAVAQAPQKTLPVGGAGDLRQRAVAHFKAMIGAALKLDPRRIDAGERLENYGLDSILSVQLTNRLGKELDNISSTLFFEVPTVNDLVDELLEQQADKLAAMLAPQAEPPAPQVTASVNTTRMAEPPPVSHSATEPAPRRPAATGDIAILALNGRFPQAPDLATLWENLKAGRDAVTEVPAVRWHHAEYYDPEPQKPGKTNAQWGGFIEDPLCFDPLFFNISPREAEMMDPKERLFLETVWHLFEEVGLTRDLLRQRYHGRVGVFVGAMYQQYHAFASDVTREALVSLTSYASIANRVSQFFDLQGPSIAVDTMCSSSLVAIHQARASLLAGECALAVAGGVNLTLHPNKFLGLSASNMIGSSPHSRSLADGDGYLPAETVSAVLLKPLQQALADGDAILAVIKGSAVNHAGAGTGYSVPNPQAQIQLAADNYRQSGVDPRSVGYVEAAVNGSPQGDAIEINALKKFYAKHAGDVTRVALGSVKSNLGHAEAASGMTQLAKVVLQLRHRSLVPSIKSQPRNPRIDLTGSPLHVQETLAVWPAPADSPRRAAIASWGAAGANAHLIVEEFPQTAAPRQPSAPGPQLLVLSARAEDRLPLMAAALADYLAFHEDADLGQVAFTLQHHREAMRYRVAWVFVDRAQAVNALRAFAEGRREPAPRQGRSDNRHQVEHLLDGDAGAVFLQTVIQSRDLAKLADLWVQGAAIPWLQCHDHTASPLPLPLYPFCRQRYVVGTIGTTAPLTQPATTMENPPVAGATWLAWLQATVGELLGLAADQVPPQRPLIELGFGSLNGVQLKAALEKSFAVSVPAALLNGFQDLRALADELEQRAPFAAAAARDEAAPLLPTIVPQPELRFEPFPLSDIQQSYLLGRKLGGDAAIGCHIYLELQAPAVGLGGDGFDLYRLNQAWQQLINHHDMLRTVFLANGTQQVLAEVEPYRFKVRDLRRVGAETRAATMAATRERMSHHVYAADQWPLFEVRVSICPNATLIHFSIDELLLDWSGLEMLFRQWHEHYQNPDLQRPTPAVTFRDYMTAVKAFESAPRFQQDLAYHLRTLADAARGPALPAAAAAITAHHCTRFEDTLDAPAWQQLKATAAALQVTPTALLLSLFSEVLHAWCEQPSFLLILTTLNRTPLHPDLDQVLAPFISTSLFRADRPVANAADTIVATQQRLWDDLDHNSASGIRVLRELKKQAGVAKDLSLPVVFTSLLGRDSGAGEALFAEITYSITQTPRVFLDHQVHERDGVLHFNWDLVQAAFAPGLAATLFAAYGEVLRQVAAMPACLQENTWRATLQRTPQPRISARPDAAHAPFPLTDQQQAYAFGRSKFGGNLSSQVYMFFDAEDLDVARLTAAWHKVMARHAMLHAVILPNGTQQIQTDLPEFEITQHDFRDCETETLAGELEAVGAAMMAGTVPLGAWPYCDLRVSLLPAGRARVHLSVDMIIADGTAINRLARELFENYAEPALTRPPLEISFRDYVVYLQDHKQSAAYRDDVAYWENKFQAIPAGPALPRIGDGNVHATESFESLLRGWPQLVAAAQQHEVAEGMILLAVYGEVLSAWCGGEPFTLVIPCWQRPALHPQLDEVVGDFTAMSWVVVQNDGRGFAEKVQAYHQTVTADLAHMAVSGLGALRKQVAKRGKAAPLSFPVVFTNMGGPTRFSLPDGIQFGGYLSQTSQVHMDNISLENEGALQFRWDVAKGVFPDGLIAEMFAGYQRFLVALADDPQTWTRRDFSALIQAKPVKYQRLAAETRALAMEEV